jgi:beta-lactamase class A
MKIILSLILFFLLGGATGFFIGSNNSFVKSFYSNSTANYEESFELQDKGFKYISPLLQCEISNQIDLLELQPITQAIQESRTKFINQYPNSKVSVYFRDLSNGGWIGIEEKNKFVPASMLKVSELIAFLLISEENPSILDTEILYSESKAKLYNNTYPQFFNKSPTQLVVGQHYKIKDLLEYMIKNSDNTALYLLAEQKDSSATDKLNQKLMIDLEIKNNEGFISPRSYSSFFRILYNASFLNKKNSEYALELLTQTTFNEGLRAGVPKDVIIASKFGERTGVNGSEQRYLHDCGVVYHPSSPYLLCVMTSGDDYAKQAQLIKNISNAVYMQIDKNSK